MGMFDTSDPVDLRKAADQLTEDANLDSTQEKWDRLAEIIGSKEGNYIMNAGLIAADEMLPKEQEKAAYDAVVSTLDVMDSMIRQYVHEYETHLHLTKKTADVLSLPWQTIAGFLSLTGPLFGLYLVALANDKGEILPIEEHRSDLDSILGHDDPSMEDAMQAMREALDAIEGIDLNEIFPRDENGNF